MQRAPALDHGQRTQACTILIQMSTGRQAIAHPLRPGLLLHPFIQPAGSLLSSDRADAPCPPRLRPGCSLCQDCCSPHVTPPLTAFSLCSVRPSRPLTCFCDLMSQHLQRLGYFFFPVVNLLCLLVFNMLVICGPLWNAFAL